MLEGKDLEAFSLAIVEDMRERVRKIERMQKPNDRAFLRITHRLWVKIVQQSATETEGAPITQIITKGYNIGWKVWGKYESSMRRIHPRLDIFQNAWEKVVTQEFLDKLETRDR